jgi:uncharacterized protein (DUF58 family)
MIGTLDPALLAELRRLELKTKRSVSSDLCGRYRSAFRGTGLVYSDIREYQPGDDPKHIHWKVTARTGTTHIKSFEEDRLLSILLLVDCSGSTGAGLGKSVHSRSMELAALLTLLARQNGDAIGLGLFADEMQVFLPPSRKRSQSELILAELLSTRLAEGSTSIANALDFVRNRQRARSIIFVISDFIAPSFQEQLRSLAYRHDVIGVKFAGAQVTSIPSAGLIRVRDPETGELVVVDSGSKKFREQYQERSHRQLKQSEEMFVKSGADLLVISENPLRELSRFMDKRVARYR